MAKMIEEPILIRGKEEVGFFFLSLYPWMCPLTNKLDAAAPILNINERREGNRMTVLPLQEEEWESRAANADAGQPAAKTFCHYGK